MLLPTLLLTVTSVAYALPALAPRAAPFTSSTQNDVNNNVACKAVTVLFARGTTEQGNVGTITGPPFFRALSTTLGSSNLAVQGISYPASVAGFLAGGDAAGSRLMAQLVAQVQTQCPTTKLVMSGYSQGGQLVHKAAALLTAAQGKFVSSVVIFGDPDKGQPLSNIDAGKVDTVCHAGDNICDGGNLVLAPHLTYAQDAASAAAFVVGKARLKDGVGVIGQ